MRILLLTPNIYNDNYKEFQRYKSGFGMMVNSIFCSLSADHEVFLLTHYFSKGADRVIVRHTIFDMIFHMHFADIINGLCILFVRKQRMIDRIKNFYYTLNKGAVRRVIKSIKPDVVNIHGAVYASYVFSKVCEELNVPYVISLHGLNGLEHSIQISDWEKNLERKYIVEAALHKIPITVVSSGIKRKIEKNYLSGFISENIYVIANGLSIKHPADYAMGKTRLQFGEETVKKIICIGPIEDNKNQQQLIRIMPNLIKSHDIRLILCGEDHTDGRLLEFAKSLRVDDYVIFMGYVNHDELMNLMGLCNLNAVVSISEGFGMTIIEGFSVGIPTVSFKDLDAICDLYDNQVMEIAKDRDDASLTEAINIALKREWDKEYIRRYAEKFTLDNMARKYVEVFKAAYENFFADA